MCFPHPSERRSLWKQGLRRGGIATSANSTTRLALDHFGASAPGPVLMREYGLTAENVCKRARALLERNHA